MTKEEFMILAMGADTEALMMAMDKVLASRGRTFTREEAEAMRWGLTQPEVRMEVATLFADAAEGSGVFE